MATFQYKGFDAAGKAVRGLLEAPSAKAARESLLARAVFVERIGTTSRGTRFAALDRSTLYRELATLVDAGVPLARALDMLIDTPGLAASRPHIARVRDAIKDGADLATAFAAGAPLSSFERAMLGVAEQSAAIGPVLDRLADFLDEHDDMRQRVRSALIYPAIVVGMGICVAAVMLGVLLPRMQSFLAETQVVSMPALTRFMLAVGRFSKVWGLVVLLLIVGGVALLRTRLRADDGLRRRWDRRLFRLPGVGRGYSLLVNMRFARTLCLLLQGGVPLIDGVVLASQSTGSPWVTYLMHKESEKVRHGDRLSDALGRVPPLAGSLPGWVRVGEASGGMVRLLERAAKRYEARWTRFLARALSVLEPVVILLIGGFVLLVTLSVLLPVLDMSRAVQP